MNAVPRRIRLILALVGSISAWYSMYSTFTHSHWYMTDITGKLVELAPPLPLVMGWTIIATATTILLWGWYLASFYGEKPKRKRKETTLAASASIEREENTITEAERVDSARLRLPDAIDMTDDQTEILPAQKQRLR